MTCQNEIIETPNYVAIHNDGFVGLVDSMGSDETIEQAARVSYSKGTRKISDTKNLIRYLIRNQHSSPLEMGTLIWHMRLPIFVARQIIRHRTFSFNELSLRYSEAEDSFYVPAAEYVQEQSVNNKQGRSEKIVGGEFIFDTINSNTHSYELYERSTKTLGVARELSRINLPVNLYTEWYMKTDLNNLMKFLKLRMHQHAQRETRDYANAMYKFAKQKFPLSMEAFDDYVLNSISFSSIELKMFSYYLSNRKIQEFEECKKLYQLSKREYDEFLDKVKILENSK